MACGLSICDLVLLSRVLYATADALSGKLNSVLGLSLLRVATARLRPSCAAQTKVLA